jgi:hypothetical protein
MKIEDQYKFVRGLASDEELEKYRLCFSENGSEKSIELLKWFHQKNLPGSQVIYYAIDKGSNQIAAIYTYLPVKLLCMGRIVTAMQSFDTLTDYRHRSKGLFIKLASKLEKEESLKNNELVFGFPNENSVHGFVKKLGFTYFGEVPFLIKPMRVAYLFRKLLKKKVSNVTEVNVAIESPRERELKPGRSIKIIYKFGEDYNRLWEKIAPLIHIATNRNSEYMNWRYVDKPGEYYSLYGFYENGILKGIVIFTLKNKHEGKIGYLMEILFDPEYEKAGIALLKFCCSTLRKNKADLVLAWCFSHSFNYFCHRKAGFYKFPEKLRPQKLGMIAKTLNSHHSSDIYNIKNWYFSYSDSDTV